MISRIAIIEAALVSALTKIVDDLNTGKRKPPGFTPAPKQNRASRPIDKLAHLPRPQLFR